MTNDSLLEVTEKTSFPCYLGSSTIHFNKDSTKNNILFVCPCKHIVLDVGRGLNHTWSNCPVTANNWLCCSQTWNSWEMFENGGWMTFLAVKTKVNITSAFNIKTQNLEGNFLNLM